jgi:hypothetical protein
MKSCENPRVECSIDAQTDPSFIPLDLRETCLTAPETEPRCQLYVHSSMLQCVDELSDKSNWQGGECSSALHCMYYNPEIYWSLSNDSSHQALMYGLAWYNNKMQSNLTEGDFVGNSIYWEFHREEIRTPLTAAVCVDESSSSVTNSPKKVARGRYSTVEALLDHGTLTTEKYVKFVDMIETCASAEPGTLVRPFEIGENPLDLAFHTYGPTQRRFAFKVPDRRPGKNFFKMCERAGVTGAWTEIPETVYVFGAAAQCGDPDCSHSDFTSKMANDVVSRIYFTVITATTVGFGDISPNSTREKMLVVFGSVLSMLLQHLW